MADPPSTAQPPPLPPLPLRPVSAPQPFPPANDPAPDTLRLGAPRATLLPPPPDPLTESTAALLRQELALAREVFREALPTQPSLAAPALPAEASPVRAALEGPGSLRTRTRGAVAALTVGKYGGVVLLGGIALRAVAKIWPASGHAIETILQALGL